MFSKVVAAIMLAIIASFFFSFDWDTAAVMVLIPGMAALAAISLGEI